MNRVTINGVTIDVPEGSNINSRNGVIYVNDRPYDGEDGRASGIVKIEIHGDPLNIQTDRGDVEVHGSVQGKVDAVGSVNCEGTTGDVDAGGTVHCGDVQGSVDSGGSVNCKNVGGDVDAGGSVTCENVGGDVDAGGSVTCENVGGDVDAAGSVKMRK